MDRLRTPPPSKTWWFNVNLALLSELTMVNIFVSRNAGSQWGRKEGVMENLSRRIAAKSETGKGALYSTVVLGSCLGLFLITIGFHHQFLLCAMDHLIP